MSYQPITATVAPADVAAIKAAIATIQQKLPFLISLTDQERKSLPKTGPNSLSFVEHAQTAADNNPTILPGSFAVLNSVIAPFSSVVGVRNFTVEA